MAHDFRCPERRQTFLLPSDMRDWLPEDDIVHLILDAVVLMDLAAFEVTHKLGGAGQAPFAPSMRTHSAKTAGQVAVLRLTAGLRDHVLARASTALACSSKSMVLGSKGAPTHRTISAWLSCFGSPIASRNSA